MTAVLIGLLVIAVAYAACMTLVAAIYGDELARIAVQRIAPRDGEER